MIGLNMPSRKIPKNYNNITGKISSKKSKNLLHFESKLERDYYFLFEYDKTIERIESQPLVIQFEFEGEIHNYRPDVLLKQNTSPYGHYIIGEVKYRSKLMESFNELRPRFEAAIQYCKRQKEETYFKIFTDGCLQMKSDIHVKNISFLLSYETIDAEHFHSIHKVFRRYDTVQDVLNKITPDRYAQMSIVPTLWAMMRYHAFQVDLFSPLSLTTVLENLGSCVYPYEPEDAYYEY